MPVGSVVLGMELSSLLWEVFVQIQTARYYMLQKILMPYWFNWINLISPILFCRVLQEYAKLACSKTHPCGHPCGGVKNEETCLPCLHGCDKNTGCLKQDADDMCMICFTEALSAAPAIQVDTCTLWRSFLIIYICSHLMIPV